MQKRYYLPGIIGALDSLGDLTAECRRDTEELKNIPRPSISIDIAIRVIQHRAQTMDVALTNFSSLIKDLKNGRRYTEKLRLWLKT